RGASGFRANGAAQACRRAADIVSASRRRNACRVPPRPPGRCSSSSCRKLIGIGAEAEVIGLRAMTTDFTTRDVRIAFLRDHAGAVYDAVTDNRTKFVR